MDHERKENSYDLKSNFLNNVWYCLILKRQRKPCSVCELLTCKGDKPATLEEAGAATRHKVLPSAVVGGVTSKMYPVSECWTFSGCVTIYGVFQRVFICLLKEYLTLHFQMCTVCKVFSKKVKAINCLTEMFFNRRMTRCKVHFHILLEILTV